MKQTFFADQQYDKTSYVADYLPKGDYESCVFRNCDFSGSDLEDIRFFECEFTGCNFTGANIKNVALQDVLFSECKLLGLLFDQCKDFGFEVRFENCQLSHASFYKLTLIRCSWKDCVMEGVDFVEADLKGSRLIHCDLMNATFENTDLQNADLSQSYNYSIDPDINRVQGARFSLPEVVGLLDKYNLRID